MFPCLFISAATDLLQSFLGFVLFFLLLALVDGFQRVCSILVQFIIPLPDAVLVCFPHELFACDPVLSFSFEILCKTFAYEWLEFSGCCIIHYPCLLVVLLVILRVFWLLSKSLYGLLVVAFVTLHVFF